MELERRGNMLDNTFQRRKEIERMLLAGKKLTVPELMQMFGVGKKAIRRDFEIINEDIPLIVKQGYGGGYFLMEGVGRFQNSLTQEQLKCLKEIIVICSEEQKEIIQSIIREFGPYICGCQ